MGAFKDSEEAEYFLGAIWERMAADPDLGPKLESVNSTMRAIYTDPAAQVTIACKPGGVVVERGETATEPAVTLHMAADMGNRFWLGAVNMPMALSRGQITTAGQMGDIMKLLPMLKPAFALYRGILEEAGRSDLATK
jgi:hypothetical protein